MMEDGDLFLSCSTCERKRGLRVLDFCVYLLCNSCPIIARKSSLFLVKMRLILKKKLNQILKVVINIIIKIKLSIEKCNQNQIKDWKL